MNALIAYLPNVERAGNHTVRWLLRRGELRTHAIWSAAVHAAYLSVKSAESPVGTAPL